MEIKLPITWSASYHPEWDTTPEAYLRTSILKPTRSRRLGYYNDPQRERKGYIGVYHLAGLYGTDGSVRFFLSLFRHKQALGLRSYATMRDALMVLEAFHKQGEI